MTSEVQTSLGKADTAIQSSDLTDYVKYTDYATSSKGGVIITNTDNTVGIIPIIKISTVNINPAAEPLTSNAVWIEPKIDITIEDAT